MTNTVRLVMSVWLVWGLGTYAQAQQPAAPSPGWQTGVRGPGQTPAPTAAPQAGALIPGPASTVQTTGQLKLEAVLTDDGQRIEQGLVWRVFTAKPEANGKPKLITTLREGSPLVKLGPGDYAINVAFGRANLTRKISVKTSDPVTEKFVLNAGGLKVTADVSGALPPSNSVTYSIQTDERDQFGRRSTILSNAKPGLIIRLNAGIYQLTSTYGDANAIVRTDVTVEAGKLTEASISHSAAKVAFKLVAEPGGDAVPDTAWSIQTLVGQNVPGQIVKESVGAFPTHILAPGTYAAIAKKDGKSYRRDFLVRAGDVVQVEVVKQQ